MRGLWEPEHRRPVTARKDRDGFYTPVFMAKLLSERPEYTDESFEAFVITELARHLKSKAGRGAAAITEEVFSLYAPMLSDFVTEGTPTPSIFSPFSDDDWLYMEEPEIETELDLALSDRGEKGRVSPSYQRFEMTVNHLLDRAVLGRIYEITTGLPRLDAWLQEAQACLQEFVLPNGLGDELVHRRAVVRQALDLYYDWDDFLLGGRPTIEDEIEILPKHVIAAFDGVKLVEVSSRREAVELFLQVQNASRKGSRTVEVSSSVQKNEPKPSLLLRLRDWFIDRRADIL